MRKGERHTAGIFGVALVASVITLSPALAAQCGNTSAGFNRWVAETKKEAAARGYSQKTINATLGNVSYSRKTINADRNQRSFKLSLDQFMKKRGAATIVRKGKQLKKRNQQLFDSLERRYGVPPGVILAIWGMETGFGGFMGKSDTISALATLAYDCRRSQFFTNELYAAMTIVQQGQLSRKQMRGAGHGELGHTQFLPSSYLKFAVDGDGNGRRDLVGSKTDALASTANYLRAHGWKRGRGYQPGERNFRAIQAWNAASVYQQSIAIIGYQIDN